MQWLNLEDVYLLFLINIVWIFKRLFWLNSTKNIIIDTFVIFTIRWIILKFNIWIRFNMKMMKNMQKPLLVKHKLLCTTNVSHKCTVLGNSHYYSNKSKGTIQINSQGRPIMLYTLLFFRLYDFHYFIGICLLLYAIFFSFFKHFLF